MPPIMLLYSVPYKPLTLDYPTALKEYKQSAYSAFSILDPRPARIMTNLSDLSCAFPENARPTMSTLLFLPRHRATALDLS